MSDFESDYQGSNPCAPVTLVPNPGGAARRAPLSLKDGEQMAMPQKALLLVPVGNPPPVLLRYLEEPLALQLGLRIVVSKTALSTPTYAFNKDRAQYHCNAIMRRLVTLMEPGHAMVMGVTDVDLFVPDSPFVLGEADRESKSAVLSVSRLRQGVE